MIVYDGLDSGWRFLGDAYVDPRPNFLQDRSRYGSHQAYPFLFRNPHNPWNEFAYDLAVI